MQYNFIKISYHYLLANLSYSQIPSKYYPPFDRRPCPLRLPHFHVPSKIRPSAVRYLPFPSFLAFKK